MIEVDAFLRIQILAMADLGREFAPPKEVIAWVMGEATEPSSLVQKWFADQMVAAEQAAILYEKAAAFTALDKVFTGEYPWWADQWWVIVLGLPWANNLQQAIDEALKVLS